MLVAKHGRTNIGLGMFGAHLSRDTPMVQTRYLLYSFWLYLLTPCISVLVSSSRALNQSIQKGCFNGNAIILRGSTISRNTQSRLSVHVGSPCNPPAMISCACHDSRRADWWMECLMIATVESLQSLKLGVRPETFENDGLNAKVLIMFRWFGQPRFNIHTYPNRFPQN